MGLWIALEPPLQNPRNMWSLLCKIMVESKDTPRGKWMSRNMVHHNGEGADEHTVGFIVSDREELMLYLNLFKELKVKNECSQHRISINTSVTGLLLAIDWDKFNK